MVQEYGFDLLAKAILPIASSGLDVFAKAGGTVLARSQSGGFSSSDLNNTDFVRQTNAYALPEVGLGAIMH